MDKRRIAREFVRSDIGRIGALSQHLPKLTEENKEKTQYAHPASQPRFEPTIPRTSTYKYSLPLGNAADYTGSFNPMPSSVMTLLFQCANKVDKRSKMLHF
jgi:hypothetical protein